MSKAILGVKVGRKGIRSSIQDFEKYKKVMDAEADYIIDQVSSKFVSEGNKLFKEANYDGVNDVKVKRTPSKTGYDVTISGEALYFIEYGTGEFYNTSRTLSESEYANQFLGSRSKTIKGKPFYKANVPEIVKPPTDIDEETKKRSAKYTGNSKAAMRNRKSIAKREIKPIGFYGANEVLGSSISTGYLKRSKGAMNINSKKQNIKGGYWFYTAKPGNKLKLGQVAYSKNPSGRSMITRGNPPNNVIPRLEDKVSKFTKSLFNKEYSRLFVRFFK